MAKKKKIEIVEAPVAEVVVEPVFEVATPKAKSVGVYDFNQHCVRTYSEAEHGPEFRKLAFSFATKVPGGVVL